jgi:putative copper resistance protein D
MIPRRLRLAGGLAALVAVAAACGTGSDRLQVSSQPLGVVGGHAHVGDLTITRAYIPQPASRSVAAAYFTITNNGPADRLLSVRADGVDSATLHRYETHPGGLEQMVELPRGATVPAHGRLTLAPGSFHLMLQHLDVRLRAGTVERLTLRFAHAGSTTLAVPVVGLTGLPGGAADAGQMPGMSMTTGDVAAVIMQPVAPVTATRLVTTWSAHPWSALAASVLLLLYLFGWRVVRRRGTPWSGRAAAAWCAGVGLLVLATQGGLRAYDDELFWVHMVAHLTLVMVVPILLLAGRPLELAAKALLGPARDRFERALHGPVVSALTHPGVGLVAYTGVIVGTHLTGFMNETMIHPWLTGMEQALYVVAGLLLFLPLIGHPPIRWQLSAPLRMAVLVIAMPVDTFTGVILGQTERYPWPAMAAMHPAWAPSLLTDLHAGGAIMWVGGDAIMALMFVVAAVGWARAATTNPGTELGGWLEAVRSNYQRDLVGGETVDPDSDEAYESYNAYLREVSGRDR